MRFDLERTFESKRAYRQALAARPVAEKLRLLDELRERALVIRRASTAARPHGVVMELPAEERPNLISPLKLERRALTLRRHERSAPAETRGVITGLPPRATKTIIAPK